MQTKKHILDLFYQKFSTAPRLFFSPGRINLLGEHIDYNDGFVLPAAINKGIYIAIQTNQTNSINIIAAECNDDELNITTTTLHKQDGWKNYILGVLFLLQKQGKIVGGFNAAFGGDLPQGAGLSSSAAIEAGFLFALNQLFSLELSKLEMAKLAQQAEHIYAGTKCGIMDMFANLHAIENHCLLLDCASLSYETLPLQLTDYNIVLINTNIQHNLATSGYNTRREECQEGLSFFRTINKNIKSFRFITPTIVEQFSYEFSDEVYKRCLYVTQEIERTKEAANYLKNNEIVEFGKLMYKTHKGLKELFNVSCTELNFLVNAAKEQQDVIGARMMGGGFGGCTINLIHKKTTDSIVHDISEAYLQEFSIEPSIYIVETANGTHEVA